MSTKTRYEELSEQTGNPVGEQFQESLVGYRNGRNFAGFKPYRGKDVKQGKGGYVQVTIPDGGGWCWARMTGATSVELFGWGDTYAEIGDFSEADQEALQEAR